jgi:hypothetical protein
MEPVGGDCPRFAFEHKLLESLVRVEHAVTTLESKFNNLEERMDRLESGRKYNYIFANNKTVMLYFSGLSQYFPTPVLVYIGDIAYTFLHETERAIFHTFSSAFTALN